MRRLSLPVPLLLLLLALVEFGIIYLSFYPGLILASPDTWQQLKQARGLLPFNDWHPPILAYLWSKLIQLTGQDGSLFWVQTGVVVSSSFLLAWGAHRDRRVQSKWLPYYFQLIPLFPFVLCLLGWVWKDVAMTWLSVLGLALVYFCSTLPGHWLRVASFLPAIGLWALATAFRPNGILYVIFLLPLAAVELDRLWRQTNSNCSGQRAARPGRLTAKLSAACSRPLRYYHNCGPRVQRFGQLAVLLLVVALVFAGSLQLLNQQVARATHPQETHQVDQLFLDDILVLNSPSEIKKLPGTEKFKAFLLETHEKCQDKPQQNLLWSCAVEPIPPGQLNDGTQVFPVIAEFHPQFYPAWKQTMRGHGLEYLGYRSNMFSRYLFETRGGQVPGDQLTAANRLVFSDYPMFRAATAKYTDITYKPIFPLFTKAFFWLGLALFFLFLRGRKKLYQRGAEPQGTGTNFGSYIGWSCLASIFSIISLFPIVPAPEYRYCYFAVVLTTISAGWIWSDWQNSRRLY